MGQRDERGGAAGQRGGAAGQSDAGAGRSGGGAFSGLGTQLRHVLELMDADVAGVLADLGLAGYRPRFSPIVRALVALGPLPIRELARAISVTHSAASQTVAAMSRHGFVALEPGQDARQRVVHLTERTRQALPLIQAEWAATSSAAAELDAELPFPLGDLVPAIAAALERKPFRQRIADSAWSAGHPGFGAAIGASTRDEKE
jgi:DNA-binding MarR family transcriptional regulator